MDNNRTKRCNLLLVCAICRMHRVIATSHSCMSMNQRTHTHNLWNSHAQTQRHTGIKILTNAIHLHAHWIYLHVLTNTRIASTMQLQHKTDPWRWFHVTLRFICVLEWTQNLTNTQQKAPLRGTTAGAPKVRCPQISVNLMAQIEIELY